MKCELTALDISSFQIDLSLKSSIHKRWQLHKSKLLNVSTWLALLHRIQVQSASQRVKVHEKSPWQVPRALYFSSAVHRAGA
jgi:hypothetical protein